LASRSLKTRTSASAPAAPLSVPDNSDDVDIVDDKWPVDTGCFFSAS
jgi:hypothetical protein